MSGKNLEVLVGVFVFLGFGALAMLALQVSGAGFGGGDMFHVQARFGNVGGLHEKAPVMIGGVRVGRVSRIRIDKEDYSAVVTLDIQSEYDNLPIDTGASILTSGLLGARFVGLEPGAEELFLSEGDELDITQSSLQLETLISQFIHGQGKKPK